MENEKLLQLCSELAIKVYFLENKTIILESILFEFLVNAGVITEEELKEKIKQYNDMKLKELKSFSADQEDLKIIS